MYFTTGWGGGGDGWSKWERQRASPKINENALNTSNYRQYVFMGPTCASPVESFWITRDLQLHTKCEHHGTPDFYGKNSPITHDL